MNDATGSDSERPSPSRPSSGDDLSAAASEWLHAATSSLRHVVDLAAAEAQLAAMSGLSMIVMMAMVAAALVVAWGLVVAMVGVALVALGVPLLLAGLVLTAAQLLLAYWLWRATLKLSRNLTLPELRRTVLSAQRARGGG